MINSYNHLNVIQPLIIRSLNDSIRASIFNKIYLFKSNYKNRLSLKIRKRFQTILFILFQ